MKTATRKYGWKPDLPDLRDQLYGNVRRSEVQTDLPVRVDLRSGCSRIENQGKIGSCTANAIVACLEYLEIKETKTWVDLSRLYLYYKERELGGFVNEDAGAYLRDGIKVLVKTGTPHEELWPYDPSKWNVRPSVAAERGAKQHRITNYQRMNSLTEMKSCLAAGFPFVFGFSVYESFETGPVSRTGVMELPKEDERMIGGHAVTAVGYDDREHHLIVRNSWGLEWGENGYFYMPYLYVVNRNLSDDFWAIRK